MIISHLFTKINQPASFKRRIVTLFILLSFALILFGAVLLTSQKYADGDEAVVGIMARHILTKGEHPLFFYGQVYGGGGAIEAYLAVIPFAVFGSSPIALKSVALFLWLVTITLCYLFCLRYYTYTTAVFSSVILITATALIEWHLKMRGGYAVIPVLFMIILVYFSYLADKGSGKGKGWQFFLFGLVCGIAYYNLEIILPFLITLLIFSFFRRHIFRKWKPALLTAGGFIIGVSPILIYNLTHKFINFKYVFGRSTGQNGQNLFSHLFTLITSNLPGFFFGRNVDKYTSNPPVIAYIEYAVYIVLFIFLIIKIWPQIKKTAVSLFSRTDAEKKDTPVDIEILLVLYVIIYPIIFSVSGRIGTSPRYLLPLYPALGILAARGVNWLCTDKNRIFNITGIILLITLVISGSVNHSAYISKSRMNDDVFILEQGIVNRETSGETISKIIAFLKKRQVSRVWCTYFVQWRILFESNEEITASSYELTPGADTVRYPQYDAIVWGEGGPQAIVLHHEDTQLDSMLGQFMINGYEREVIGEYEVIIPK